MHIQIQIHSTMTSQMYQRHEDKLYFEYKNVHKNFCCTFLHRFNIFLKHVITVTIHTIAITYHSSSYFFFSKITNVHFSLKIHRSEFPVGSEHANYWHYAMQPNLVTILDQKQLQENWLASIVCICRSTVN